MQNKIKLIRKANILISVMKVSDVYQKTNKKKTYDCRNQDRWPKALDEFEISYLYIFPINLFVALNLVIWIVRAVLGK